MENKENCKIVKDLLPSYIDELTSEETKNFIENHLKDCSECKETLENMKKDFEKEKNDTKKIVDYTKKYNKNLKTFKNIVTFIFILILSIFIISILRNIIIIKSLSQKATKYDNCENFRATWSNYNNNEINITDSFYKDGKYLEKNYSFILDGSYYDENKLKNNLLYTIYYDGNEKLTYYWHADKIINYTEIGEDESNKYPSGTPKYTFNTSLYSKNLKTLLETSFVYKITSDKCNNIDCYKFTPRFWDIRDFNYFNKDTGLRMRNDGMVGKNGIYIDEFSDILYEFGTVTEEDVTPPNFEEYTVQENITK